MTVLHGGAPARAGAAPATIERYTFGERFLHWFVAVTFIALMVSGFALGYPRAAFLSGLFGGGQTMRFLHPWIGLGFTVGSVWMLVTWAKEMRFTQQDREWGRRLRTYARTGHTGLDTGRYNAGQKGYFWFAVVLALVLFVSGLPLWDTDLIGRTGHRSARLVHHVAFLLMTGGFILHVYLTTTLFPGTFSGMTTGRVTRAWAAWHHPRWFREHDPGGSR